MVDFIIGGSAATRAGFFSNPFDVCLLFDFDYYSTTLF
jgi:hypothetical protein